MDDTIVSNKKEKKKVDSKTLTRKILTLYMSSSSELPEELRARCQQWLCLDRNWDVKDEVLRRYFDEAMNTPYVPTEEDHGRLELLKKKLGMSE